METLAVFPCADLFFLLPPSLEKRSSSRASAEYNFIKFIMTVTRSILVAVQAHLVAIMIVLT